MNTGRRTFLGLSPLTGSPRDGQALVGESIGRVAEIGPVCMASQGVICRTCGESCEGGAIRFGLRPGGVALPLLDANRCNGCGDCVSDCPVAAISLKSVSSFVPALEGAA